MDEKFSRSGAKKGGTHSRESEPAARKYRESPAPAPAASCSAAGATGTVPDRNCGTAGNAQFGFPRECRMRTRAEFDAAYREGRRRSSREFTVFLRPNGLQITRFGWSIKKALGSAVKRNRLRRRLREIVRLHRREIAPGWDIVIHPRASVATANFSLLEAELAKLLPRANPAGRGPA